MNLQNSQRAENKMPEKATNPFHLLGGHRSASKKDEWPACVIMKHSSASQDLKPQTSLSLALHGISNRPLQDKLFKPLYFLFIVNVVVTGKMTLHIT